MRDSKFLKTSFFLFFFALFCVQILNAQGHKITALVPFGDNNLKIIFDKDIKDLKIEEKKIGDGRIFVDLDAVLAVEKKSFAFKNNSIINVAQNAPQIVRVVIKPTTQYAIQKDGANLYFRATASQTPQNKTLDSQNPNSVSAQNATSPKSQTTNAPKSTQQAAKQAQNSSQGKKPAQTNEQKQTQQKQATTQAQKPTTQNKTAQNAKPAQAAQPISKPIAPPKKNGKKLIVVDAGHGGKDCGAMSVQKVCEKVIVLEVAKHLETELKKRGYMVMMTRKNDIFVDLIDRTKFANNNNADLFISIHANSIPTGKKSPSGIETYYLSTNRSEKSLKVAEAENVGDIATMNYFTQNAFLTTINNHRLIASSKFAIDVQSALTAKVRKKYKVIDGGVRDGPFWVLAGALMPSILIEIGYVSHANESKLLANKEYQKLLAMGIADGVAEYFKKN